MARPVTPQATQADERPAEKPIEFLLKLPGAQSVMVAGSFNDWDTQRTPLAAGASGTWKATVWLPTGRYEYRFIADGKWMDDPRARETVQNAFGSTNSVLVV
jgi:1,4-alpha-glucan branching enzyme